MKIQFETAPQDLAESVGNYLAAIMGDELVASKTNLANIDDVLTTLLSRGHTSASVAMLAERAVNCARGPRPNPSTARQPAFCE